MWPGGNSESTFMTDNNDNTDNTEPQSEVSILSKHIISAIVLHSLQPLKLSFYVNLASIWVEKAHRMK